MEVNFLPVVRTSRFAETCPRNAEAGCTSKVVKKDVLSEYCHHASESVINEKFDL